MKYVFAFIVVTLNLVNVPLNKLFMVTQKWYLPMREKDKFIFYAFAPFYWILVGLTFIFGYPVELLAKFIH